MAEEEREAQRERRRETSRGNVATSKSELVWQRFQRKRDKQRGNVAINKSSLASQRCQMRREKQNVTEIEKDTHANAVPVE